MSAASRRDATVTLRHPERGDPLRSTFVRGSLESFRANFRCLQLPAHALPDMGEIPVPAVLLTASFLFQFRIALVTKHAELRFVEACHLIGQFDTDADDFVSEDNKNGTE